MKKLREYKANERVQVYIFNPRTNNWEWVNGIVKGIIFDKNDADFFAVTVQFERVTDVETTCDYKYIGNTPFFKYYESTYNENEVVEGFIDEDYIKPIGENEAEKIDNQQGNRVLPCVSTSFDAMEYAYDNWGETLNYMSDDEIEQVNDCENKDEVDDYLRCFYERT